MIVIYHNGVPIVVIGWRAWLKWRVRRITVIAAENVEIGSVDDFANTIELCRDKHLRQQACEDDIVVRNLARLLAASP